MRDLPRHEIEPKKVEPEYRAKETELAQRKNLKNIPIRWSGVRKAPLDPHDGSLPAKNVEFKAATAKLKKLASGGPIAGSHRTADPWRNREAQKVRGDLAGYWSDIKHEVASRLGTTGNPKLEAALQKTLGWLEMAEREGGLSTWLDAWNDAQHATRVGRMGGDVSGSWHDLAERIGNIHQGIEFCKEIVKDGFGESFGQERSSTNLVLTLDAIGLEISRQAEEIIAQGKTPEPAPLFDAIKERMKTVSERSMVAERMHTGLENGTLHDAFAAEIPDAIRQDGVKQLQDLGAYVQYCQEKAEKLQDFINVGVGDPEELADLISIATTKGMPSLESLINRASFSPSKNFAVEEISLTLHVYGRLAEEMAARLDVLSEQVSKKARRQLQGAAKMLRGRKEVAASHEPDRSAIHECRTYAQRGKLDEFWGNARAAVDKALRTPTNPGHVAGLADKFAEATREDLEAVLSSWTNRNNPTVLETLVGKLSKLGIPINPRERNPTDIAYTLSWELIAMVRNLKRRSETILANHPQQLKSITGSLESIIEVVSEELQQASLPATV